VSFICLTLRLSGSFIELSFPFLCCRCFVSANALISSLEAELEASRKSWDVAAAAKTTVEKSTKSALARAKKAEKALAYANQERIQREQAIIERLNKISALAGGKYHAFPFFIDLPISILTDVCFLIFCLCPFGSLEHTRVSLAPLQPDDDPLMAAVNLLESNWISIQEIFELASRVLTQIFAELWPKQKADMPAADLKKLATAFNTPKDPILLMKRRSVKRGVERAIALTYAHGGEKVSSSRGRPLSELWGFFEKAKKYAPGIVSIISPSAASLTSAMPVSLTPATSGSMPPPNTGAIATLGMWSGGLCYSSIVNNLIL
jgi:hypothetical protein